MWPQAFDLIRWSSPPICCCCFLVAWSRLFATLRSATHQASLSFTVSQSLLKLMSIGSMMPSNHLILCCPLLLPSVFPSIRVFPVSQLFASDGQSVGASTSPSVLPVNIRGWLPLGLTAFSWFITVYPEVNLAFSLQSWQHWCSDRLHASYKVTPWTARLGLQTTWSQKLWVDFAIKGPHFRMEKSSILN